MNDQTAFSSALLNPELPCPSGLTSWNGSDPTARFAVYRNNVWVSWVDALADTYPVVQALVGEDFFRAMARLFAQACPPRSPVLAFYGAEFADFVASFAPTASLPYLADVARLEMARVRAYHAADVAPIDPRDLHAVLADPEQLAGLQLALHPSVFVLDAAFASLAIWAAHQDEFDGSPVDPDLAQTALVFRNALEVEMREVPSATCRFVQSLQGSQTLGEAANAAHSADADFDLAQTLALLLRLQLFTHFTTGDPQHAQTH
jgi:hypothetical protein